MATKKMPLKLFVPAAVSGIALFLFARHLRMGRLGLQDVIIAGTALAVGLFIFWISGRRTTARWASEQPSPMNRRRRWLLAVGIGALFLSATYSVFEEFRGALKKWNERRQAAVAREEAMNNLHVIRTLAGRPDSAGWVPVSSTAGGFFVYVPGRFNEVTSTVEMGGRETFVVVVGARKGELKLVVMAFKDIGGGQSLEARTQDAIRQLGQFKNAIVCRRHLFADKFPLIEMEMNTAKPKGLGHIVVTDTTVYGLSVEGPELTEDLRATAKRFFDSFAVMPSEPNELQDRIPTGPESRINERTREQEGGPTPGGDSARGVGVWRWAGMQSEM